MKIICFYDNIIQKTKEEIDKYTEFKKKKLISNSNEAQTIINEFKENLSDFETFCAELFIKMGKWKKLLRCKKEGEKYKVTIKSY